MSDGTKDLSSSQQITFSGAKFEKTARKLWTRFRILLEQVDKAIAQKNSVKEPPVQFTLHASLT